MRLQVTCFIEFLYGRIDKINVSWCPFDIIFFVKPHANFSFSRFNWIRPVYYAAMTLNSEITTNSACQHSLPIRIFNQSKQDKKRLNDEHYSDRIYGWFDNITIYHQLSFDVQLVSRLYLPRSLEPLDQKSCILQSTGKSLYHSDVHSVFLWCSHLPEILFEIVEFASADKIEC